MPMLVVVSQPPGYDFASVRYISPQACFFLVGRVNYHLSRKADLYAQTAFRIFINKGEVMRILLLSNLYPPYIRGGAEITAGDIASGLRDKGHEVIVLTSWYGLPKALREGSIWRTLRCAEPAHFNVRSSIMEKLNKLNHYYLQYHCPENAQELRKAIATAKPDLLYIWEINGIGIISLLKALQEFTIPIVFHLGSYWWQYIHSPQTEYSHLRLRKLKQIVIGSVPPLTYTSLIAVSRAVKQEYVQAGCDPERIEIINSGIDPRFMDLPRTAQFNSKDLTNQVDNPYADNKGLHLVYAGRIRVEKGILVILKALDMLVNEQGKQDLHLSIFGEGDEVYISELQAFLKEKHLTQVVTFHGKVPQDDLIQCYDLSDVMVVPSLWQEPFGLVIAEAMARGLPVIASDVGGPAEMITHGVDGLLFEPGDEQALSLAITRLLEQPEERERLAKAAYKTVRSRFTRDENVRRAEQHLLRAVHEVTVHTR